MTATTFTENLDTPVELISYASGDKFKVTYGHHVVDCYTYEQACKELGACILHSLACAGKIHTKD